MLLEIAFLLALRTGAGVGPLALLAVLGTMSKEFFILLTPLVFIERHHAGRGAAVRQAVLVAAPALVCLLVLRLAWVPHLCGLETRVRHPCHENRAIANRNL